MNTKKFIILIVVAIVLIFALGFALSGPRGPSKYDGFAQCLSDSGAKFYGAFWCPHCQNQKKMFGTAAKKLPYVECSNLDRSQTQVCIDNEITSYPTWTFANPISFAFDGQPVLGDGTWTFKFRPGASDDFQVSSKIAPTTLNGVWTFSTDARMTGEVPLEILARQTSCELPQE